MTYHNELKMKNVKRHHLEILEHCGLKEQLKSLQFSFSLPSFSPYTFPAFVQVHTCMHAYLHEHTCVCVYTHNINNQFTYKGERIRMAKDFSTTLEAGK